MKIKIDKDYNRLDKFIYQYLENVPLSLIQRLIRKYKIKINNKKSKANSPLINGDLIYIYYDFDNRTDKSFNINLSNEDRKKFDSHIIFQNSDFLIINKIRGFAVQRGSKVKISLKDFYESLMKQSLYIVHRLDKDTSGLMIFAKNRLAASNISKLFQDNQIHKYYIAITNKAFKKPSDILSNENNEKKILKSQYRRIRIANYEFAYLVKLITGRKHQIRLQFYLNNNPILGDKKFSEQNDGNLMLKSTSLSFFYQDKFYKFKLDLTKIFE